MLSWRDWRFLYFDHKGRITRQAFWFGCVPLLLLSGVLPQPLFYLGAALGRPDLRPAGAAVLTLLLFWPSWCLAVKRRHDRGGNGLDVAIVMVLMALVTLWRFTLIDFSGRKIRRFPPGHGLADFLAGLPTSTPAYLAVSIAVSFAAFIVFIVLGAAPGTPGPNRYGPDPLARAAKA